MGKLTVLLLMVGTLLAGCSSSPYTYHQMPTPLKKGATHYYIKDPAVNLILGHGAIPNDKTFVGQDVLAQQFKNSLLESFTGNKIYAEKESDADAVVEISLDYTRTFNYGGKSLNKPQFGYQVAIKRNNVLLASYAVRKQTTRYGAMKDFAVNLEITAFKWGVEDEPQDIVLIAKTIANEVAAMGK